VNVSHEPFCDKRFDANELVIELVEGEGGNDADTEVCLDERCHRGEMFDFQHGFDRELLKRGFESLPNARALLRWMCSSAMTWLRGSAISHRISRLLFIA